MLRPNEIDAVLKAAARRRGVAPSVSTSAATTLGVPARGASGIAIPRNRVPQPGTRHIHSVPGDPNGSGTGIHPWWRYQEEAIPGGGRVMVNVGTGNVLLQDDDMTVPHKGIALAFRRTYNSQSLHDVHAGDATGFYWKPPGMYGNGWTNTFDAQLVRAPDGSVWSVFDIDGTRYDFNEPPNTWTYFPVAGNHTTLTYDGSCGLLWTKKSGTTYYFYRPAGNGGCPTLPADGGIAGGYAGRLYQIIGRNRNTSITFSYSWDNGDASTTGKINTITARTESGLTATLSFADVNGYRLLQQLTYPDGVTSVQYQYDSAGNLLTVSHPPNNSAGTRPVQWYGYQAFAGGTILNYVTSPRYFAACYSACGSDGVSLYFNFTGNSVTSSALSSIIDFGVANPAIADGSNSSVLQPGYSQTAYGYYWEAFTAGTSATYRDSNGHMTNWIVDGLGRPTQTQECTASANQGAQCTGSWLVTNETWDADDNLTSETDARGNETDYAYDAHGNAVAVGEPLTTTSLGTFKPTKLYDYDGFNNVTAYCDETETHRAGADWSAMPAASDTLCSTAATAVPHWRATFAYPSYEPNGELTSMVTPLGYTRRFAYSPAQQGGTDFGLPTGVTGDAISQLDGTTVTPAQTFWYDASGNLGCYSKGNGIWALRYDTLSRMTAVGDPDDTSLNSVSLCAKSGGRTGWNTQTTYAYFPDGSKQSMQTPSERAFGVATTYTYDLDGNVVTETAHHGCVLNQSCPAGTTQKWYDAADRLVEVQQPWDPRSYTWPSTLPYDGSPWRTRYIYDLSQGGTVSLTGSPAFAAYGNLYKTQTYLSTSDLGPVGFTDKSGSAFDALDRERTKYSYAVGTNTIEQTQLQYDGGSPAALGLLSQKTDPLGESVSMSYDEQGRVRTQTYAGDGGVTPMETKAYDAGGRIASITSSLFGTQSYTYDDDGRLTGTSEPSGGGVTDPAQIAYSYYGDGQRSSVSVTSSHFTQSNALAYSYRTDGLPQTQTVNAFSPGTWTKGYTDAGRLLSSGGVDSQTLVYDGTGQLQSYTVSGSTITYTRDPEGSPLSEAWPSVWPAGAPGPTAMTRYSTINVRGELIDGTPPGTAPNAYMTTTRSKTDNGCMAKQTVTNDGSYDPAYVPPQDYRQCVVTMSGSMSTVDYNGNSYPTGETTQFTFDAAGRATRSVNRLSAFVDAGSNPLTGGGDSMGPQSKSTTTTTTTTYDAENHTLSRQPTSVIRTTYPNSGQTGTTTVIGAATTIAWGPNGHPILVHDPNQAAATSQNTTLHWDGDMVLFVTDVNGNVIDFKPGLDGDITPLDTVWAGLTVYDRDAAGAIISNRNSTGTSGLIPVDDTDAGSLGMTPTAGFKSSSSAQAIYVRPDGFQVAGIQVNGVRAFDPKLGGWTTPDAYEGDIHDPASQQKYMWNRGNAVDYSDPSGYKSLFENFKDLWNAVVHGRCPVPEEDPLAARERLYNAQYRPDSPGREVELGRISQLPAKRGDPPKGDDGYSLELHHRNQDPNGPVDEMTRTEHRLGENHSRNHQNTGQSRSPVEHGSAWKRHVKDHWRAWWDRYMPAKPEQSKP